MKFLDNLAKPQLFMEYPSRDSVVGIATSYGQNDRRVGVRDLIGYGIFSSPQRPDRLWGPPNLIANWSRKYSGRGVKLTTHLQPVPRSSKCGSIHPLPPHTSSWHSA
jgi:hypothetical protein